MKTIKIIPAYFFLSFFFLSACSAHRTVCSDESVARVAVDTDPVDDLRERRTLKLPAFHAVENRTVVRLHFKRGRQQSVVMEGYDFILDKMRVSVSEDGVLKIDSENRKNQDNNGKNNEVDIYITVPRLTSLQNSGVMTFNVLTESFNSDFSLRNHGVLKVYNVPEECAMEHFVMSNNGVMSGNFHRVIAKSMEMANSGVFEVRFSGFSSRQFRLRNNGVFKVKEDAVLSDFEQCDMLVNGVMEGNVLKLVGEKVDLTCSGVNRNNFHLDCSDLIVKNSGNSRLVLTGTADKVTVKNSGVASVETSGLNE